MHISTESGALDITVRDLPAMSRLR